MKRFSWVGVRRSISRCVLLGAAVIALAAAFACGGDADDARGDDARLRAVASIGVFADIVSEVGGDRVEVESLLPPGADPHTYEATPGDVRRVADAGIVFANGLDLEPAALRVIEPNISSGATLVLLAEEAAERGAVLREGGHEEEPEEGDDHEEVDEHEAHDPHLWLSVDNARVYAAVIRDAVSAADPDGASTYAMNFETYAAALDELDGYVRERVASIRAERRYLVTTHDAFGYLAAYLDFEVAAVVTISPGQEASAAGLADLREAVRDTGVPAVFREPQVGPEAEALASAAGDLGVRVCVLYSDALDGDVTSYVELMRFNADELVRCLAE